MPFSPTITHESKTFPGVQFTVHRMGYGRRTELQQKTLELRQRLRELEADNPPPNDREKILNEQLEIARKKALAVPPEEFDGVLQNDIKPLTDELVLAGDPAIRKKRAVLNEEYAMVDAKVRMEWIRAGLVSVTGGDLDSITADQLLQYGPPELSQEIYAALDSDGTTRGEAAKNSQSPTTSGVAVAGEIRDSIAPNAAPLPVETI